MRRDARVVAFQVIFSKMFASDQYEEPFFAQLKKENDIEFAKNIIENFSQNQSYLADLVKSNLVNYELDRIYKVDLALLYLALTEILYMQTPKQVAINESLEIAKKFSTPKSSKFINGVITSILKDKETR